MAASLDGVVVEHLNAGGESVVIWLRNILLELEIVPFELKRGVVVAVYRGSGKDLLHVDSYREVTLTFIVSKVLKFLVLDRLNLCFLRRTYPMSTPCQPDSRQEGSS